MKTAILHIALSIGMAVSCAVTTGCAVADAAPTGRNVSNRCSLTECREIASWKSDGEIIFPDSVEADCWRTVRKDFSTPLDLSATPLLEYGILASEGPGRDFVTRLTLRSSDGKEFSGEAHIIPTLWQSVILDMNGCGFLDDVVSVEIALRNEGKQPWMGAKCLVGDLKAGKALDLDFDVPGSAMRLKPVGDASVGQGKDVALIDFKRGSAVEIDLSDSRNSIYNPRLDMRNTVCVALENRSSADSLRLYFTTDENPEMSPENSKTMSLPEKDGMQYVGFNLSDRVHDSGRLRALRFEPLGGEGTLIIDRISFEREAPISVSAGTVNACMATREAVTVTGTLDSVYTGEGAVIELRHSPMWKGGLPFDSLELLAVRPAKAEFRMENIPNSRLGGEMSHLSSRFEAAVRLTDGRVVKIGEPFFIENWRDFIDNPYNFPIAERAYPVLDYGAKGDGVTNDNAAIQKAIDRASADGGGKVVLTPFPDGKSERQYLATNLKLRKGVDLVIAKGAVLRQSPKFSHYTEFPPEYGHDNVIPGVPWTHCMYTNRPLILAKDTERVRITGGGRIRMDDTYSENPAWTHYARTCSDRIHIVPIAVCNTRHVEISDIDIVRCSNYHTIFYRADSVFIGNLKMYDVACLSGDGLSFGNAVTNVRVGRCVFESNDDGIVLCSSYRDPRGGEWRVRVDSIDSSVRHIEVIGSYIDSGRGGAGKAIALIPWGSTNPRQDFNEIDDIEVRDCVLRGGHSVGSWPDNPFDGKPFDNSEPDDYAPVKNLRIFGNEYLSPVELNGVVPVTLLTDCGLHSGSDFKNSDFTDRLAYWTHSRGVRAIRPGEIELSDGVLYQGLYLLPGSYHLSWSGEGEITAEVKDMYGKPVKVTSGGQFDVTSPSTFLVGFRGSGATLRSVSLNKSGNGKQL